ncbi:MAG: M23 family metallopeptidase [Deltaproteobacteria bacterium]|nr:M23 family metallopeptidase [Deltaproteobacteria bacterium]
MTALCTYRFLSVPLAFLGVLRWLLPALLFLCSSACTPSGIYHQVRPGQTLYRISKTYQQNETNLARINGISDPTQLKTGTRLFIPGATRQLNVPATVSSTTADLPPTPVASSSGTKPAQKKAPPPTKPQLRITTPKISPAETRSTKKAIQLHWPLRGKILQAFGEKRQGSGKGIEIATPVGTPVLAAAAGKVIYSGDGVQGFGYLIILQHENDFFTVYGYNRRLFARTGQFVSRGQKIADSGLSPSGETGRLHFEVRRGKQAVNPILYLP